MKNYQKLNYQNYFTQSPSGDYVLVSRHECFAPPEDPTADNPFKQRWFYDPEAGYAVRLERNACGEATYRANGTALKREERYHARKFQCVWKNTRHCDQDCARCHRKVSRTLELDKTYAHGADEPESKYEPADEAADIIRILEDKAKLAALLALYKMLTKDEQMLWGLLKAKAKKQEIADHFNLTLDGVRYREQRLFTKIRSDEALRSFFEND